MTKLKLKIALLILLSFSLSAQEMVKDKNIFSKESMSNPIQASPIQANEKGIAIDGFDPVAYFTVNRAVRGTSVHSCQYQNRTWHFSSAENRDKFLENPEQFVPQYGGYCAHSINDNKIVKADPKSFVVRDDKLYLYYNDRYAEKDIKLNKFTFTQKLEKRRTNWLNYKATF